ncbi:MAG: hypothetical protein R3C68_08325 [Myxococcota bacterium]
MKERSKSGGSNPGMNVDKPGKSQRKTYEPPAIADEEIFERQALQTGLKAPGMCPPPTSPS